MKKQRPNVNIFGYGAKVVESPKGDETRWEKNARLRQETEAQRKAAERAAWLQTPEGKAHTQAEQIMQEMADYAAEHDPKLKARLLRGEVVPDSVVLGGYTTRETSITDNLKDFDGELNKSFNQFMTEWEKLGREFTSKEAVAVLVTFMTANVVRGGIAATAENWMRSAERLLQLGVLDGVKDVTGYVPTRPLDQVSQPQAPQKRQAQLDAERIETASDKEARELVGARFGAEVQKMFYTWLEQNMCNPDVWNIKRDIMVSNRIVNYIGEVLDHNPHLNPLRHNTWNFIRRSLDHAQLLGPRKRYLTADERTAASLEDTQLTNATFETKQDLVRRLGALRG